MTDARLSQGGAIDRSRSIDFEFDGKRYSGFDGDTLTSALLSNGVRLVARSFKYHRPRGIIGAWTEEPGAFVEVLGERASANQPATTVRLEKGLRARAVNCWPSLGFDLGAVNSLLAPLIPAAFYYKTFFWPKWEFYEPLIRRAAGLAGAPAAPPLDGRFEMRNRHCDVLVVGAGPAGLSAAAAAARSGARVMIADDGSIPGGSLNDRTCEVGAESGAAWALRVSQELSEMDNVLLLKNSTAWAYREHNLVLVREQSPNLDGVIERNWKVRAKRVILATGASERMLVFSGNDRPGVMLASAVQRYINRHAVKPGRRAVVCTNNDSAYEVAADMASSGIDVVAIIDSRAEVPERARSAVTGLEIKAGHVALRALGGRCIRAVEFAPVRGNSKRRVDCDLVAVSGGWNPSVQLWSQSRGKLAYDERIAAFAPAEAAQAAFCAGGASGEFTLAGSLEQGARAGCGAAADLGFSPRLDASSADREESYSIEPIWQPDGRCNESDAFLDILNDVTLRDVRISVSEGYGDIEHVKRYTTAGMGMDQGRTGSMNVIGAVASLRSIDVAEVGVTTYRSPVAPVPFGTVCGLREGSVVRPYRHTPVTEWNIENGAVMYEAGARWRRPGYYPKEGETLQDAVKREALAVRKGVGIYDGSPLGTFKITGMDSSRLVDFLYTNRMSDLARGAGRYGMMLTDDGLILDDGVCFRLSEHSFLLSTSTGNAEVVHMHIEKLLAVERPEWEAFVTNLTCQWMNATICGPLARDVVAALGTDIDLAPEAFPFMSFRDGTVAGMPARIARVSFTGELSFEINVLARDMLKLWTACMEAGAPHGIAPVGSETNHVLRAEKGFVSLGHEVDGTTDPFDLGMGWIMSRSKGDFIGRRSVLLRRESPKLRRELVGLLAQDSVRILAEGAPLTPQGRKSAAEGFVTASVWSVVHERPIALALLADGRRRAGESVYVRELDHVAEATVVSPCFYDPGGQKMRG